MRIAIIYIPDFSVFLGVLLQIFIKNQERKGIKNIELAA